MQRIRRTYLAGTTIAAAVAIALTGCSSSGTPAAETTPYSAGPAITDPATLVNTAADATAALTGAHVELDVEGTIPNVAAKEVDADLNAEPSAGSGEATLIVGGNEVEAPFVWIDDRLYADVGGQGYVDYGDGRSIYDVSMILDREQGISALLRAITDPQVAGEETLDDVPVTKVAGTVPAGAVAALTGSRVAEEAAAAPVPMTAWITPDGSRLVQLQLTPAPDATLTLELSDWNETFDITKPSDIQTPSATPDSPPPGDGPTRVPAG